jgi:hypothetical protein
MSTHEVLIQKIRNLPPDKITAVEDFVDSLAGKSSRAELYEAIASYAAAHAGTPEDLDRDFEAAAIEHWFDEEQKREAR